jgi:hypothetical protein
MQKLTFTVFAVLAAALVAFASTAAASGGSDDPPGDDHGGGGKVTRTVAKSGTCSAASHSRLKVKADDGRLETEFEVDQNRVGKRWRVTIKRNGSNVFRGIRKTQAPSGSFEVRRLLAGGAGSRIVATAKSLSSGETCRAAITF